MAEKKWQGSPPVECDICKVKISRTFVDGKTAQGPWANMCMACFKLYGIKLGQGYGQKYEKRGDDFVKTEG